VLILRFDLQISNFISKYHDFSSNFILFIRRMQYLSTTDINNTHNRFRSRCRLGRASLIERHGLLPHLYADDTPVYGSCPPAAVDALSSQVTECADDIATWMKSKIGCSLIRTKPKFCGARQAGASINFHPLEC